MRVHQHARHPETNSSRLTRNGVHPVKVLFFPALAHSRSSQSAVDQTLGRSLTPEQTSRAASAVSTTTNRSGASRET